jgi:hypothetical protein
MNITVISWKDERWSADKETLKEINKLINKNTKGMKESIVDKIMIFIGWIAVSPFVIRDGIIFGFKWLIKKIKRKS